MESKFLLCIALFLALSMGTNAYNITEILNKNGLDVFATYIGETGIADEINAMQNQSTFTVLAVDNMTLTDLAKQLPKNTPLEKVKDVLSIHVLIDYWSVSLLEKTLSGKESILTTTLFDTTGMAAKMSGFVRVSASNGKFSFQSAAAAQGGAMSTVKKAVYSEPGSLAVFLVDSVILPPGILAASPSPAPAPSS